ncbi:MAG TPA: NlpC/P60 family protein [Microlunatus sp.]
MTSRSLIRRGLAVSLSGLTLGAVLVCSPNATADPAPQTISQAKAQVEKLQQQAEATDQEYLALKEKLAKSQAELKQKQGDLKKQSAKVAAMRAQVSKVALAQFQNRTLDTRTRLFLTRDATGFLNQIATVEKVSQNQNVTLQDYQVQQANLADLQRSTQADVATLTEDKKKLKQLRTDADDKVDQAQQVLDKLTTEERQRIELERRKQSAEAEKAAAAADDSTSTSTGANLSSSTTDSSSGAAAPASSGKGAQVVAFAKAQIGKPYVFGATGPSSYDCSGLTLAAWQSVGVQLDRTSQAQFGDGVSVSQSDLQPGDLVFFYGSQPSHVGIYVGGGTIIHAPRPGQSVEYTKMSYMPFSGARRPG